MKEHPFELLTIGDSSIDQFMKVDDNCASEVGGEVCFVHGTKVPVSDFSTSVAGNALNVAAGTVKLGIPTAVYSEIGNDQNAERIIDELKDRGIITEYVIKNNGTLTDIHPIIIYNQERTIFIFHEKREYKIKNWLKPKWIYYSSIGRNFEEFQKELIDYLKKNPEIGVAFNPGTYHLRAGLELINEVLQVSHILFVNKEEALQLVKGEVTEEIHRNLHKLGPKLTVITDGSKGASAFDGKNYIELPVFDESTKPVVDKTGAGDAFSSGFLSAIIKGKSMNEALGWGLVNSSGAIREIGAIKGLRDEKEIKQLLNEKR